MQMIQCRLDSEARKEPGPENTVVNGGIATRDEAAGGSRSRPYDYLVLAMSSR